MKKNVQGKYLIESQMYTCLIEGREEQSETGKWAAAEAGSGGRGEERKNKNGLSKYMLVFKILQDSMICKYVKMFLQL